MPKDRWLNTSSDNENQFHSTQFWKFLKEKVDADKFWGDQIIKYRDEPHKRLMIAVDYLPQPTAFREAAISLRAIIRDKRKLDENFEDELVFLYWLAAINSFIIPYAERLKEPGYNVFDSIPAKKFRSLPFKYDSLGYKKLDLLNKTDCKWLVEIWGKPSNHTTLNEIHRNLWDEYESKLISKRKRQFSF